MDFISVDLPVVDGVNQTATMALTPDPRRHELVVLDGVSWYRDKYLNHLVRPEDVVQSWAGIPVYHLSSSIASTLEYAELRRPALIEELTTGKYSPPAEKALQHRNLDSDATARDVAFLSVDICRSTALRALNSAGFERAHKMFMQELGTLVGQFNGTILKSTGDGFIACIDHPSFTSLCDQTVDLGTSLQVVLRNSVNPALRGAGLTAFDIRVGADYGEAKFRSIIIPTTGYATPEVASDALNRAVKIQETCAPGEFRIGRSLYGLTHVQWLERSTEVSFDGESVGIPGYQIYTVI